MLPLREMEMERFCFVLFLLASHIVGSVDSNVLLIVVRVLLCCFLFMFVSFIGLLCFHFCFCVLFFFWFVLVRVVVS